VVQEQNSMYMTQKISHSYNKVERHDYEIEQYVDQQASTSVDYALLFNLNQ
jgi:hypothetical protein